MTPERFRGLLDAYGGDPGRWPESERPAMEAFLAADPGAEVWLRDARDLDRVLADFAVPDLNVAARVLASIPRSRVERLGDWLLPREPLLWWRPAMAAALPLVLGVAIGLADGATAVTSAPDWTAQEQALLAGDTGSAWYE